MTHIVIWKLASAAVPPSGDRGLLGFAEYVSSGAGKSLKRWNSIGQVGNLAAVATAEAIQRQTNVSIVWGMRDPATMRPDEFAQAFMDLRPRVVICPERPGKVDRWCVASGAGTPES